MIHALDHVAIGVAALEAGRAVMSALLGRGPDRDAGSAWFALANTALLVTVQAPAGLAWAGFATAELDSTLRLLARRGVGTVGDPMPWTGADGVPRRAVRLDPVATAGLDLRLVERPVAPGRPGIGLDHLVIRTPHPERAVAFYGGRLGLDLRLDRSNPQWGTRFLFFRCGDLVVEVVHKLAEPEGPGPDTFSGLAWRAPDLAGEHARLMAAGVPVSELRPGRKPGTRLFTVRDQAALVPGIFIGAH